MNSSANWGKISLYRISATVVGRFKVSVPAVPIKLGKKTVRICDLPQICQAVAATTEGHPLCPLAHTPLENAKPEGLGSDSVRSSHDPANPGQ